MVDILQRTAPALSANADVPLGQVAKPPESASNSEADQAAGVAGEMSPVEQAVAREARKDGAPETVPVPPDTVKSVSENAQEPQEEPPAPEAEAVPPPIPPGVKKEITKARNRQREAEFRAREAEEKADRALRMVDELMKRMSPQQAPQDAVPRPTRDKFDTPEKFDAALESWAAEEGGRKALEKAQREAQTRTQEAQRQAAEAELSKINTAWQGQRASALEKYPDYVEVAESPELSISVPMAHAILSAPNGTEVSYHLGKNPDEAKRINALPNAGLQILEIGRLAERLSRVPPVPGTRAPAPIKPLNGASAPADTSEREPSMAEWGERRTKEIMASRAPFVRAQN